MAWPFSRRGEVKENPVGASLMVPGGVAWSKPANTRAYIEEGYQLNVIVYRAVNEITRAIGDLEIEVHDAKGEVIENHEALKLLAKPNPMQGYDGWAKEVFTNYLLTGEMACARYPDTGRPAELWSLNPLYIKVQPGRGGVPFGYTYDQSGKKTEFLVDRMTGRSAMFFFKSYNPLDYWRGQSPLVAAGIAADTHNAGMKWNYSLLRNGARPSGLIKLAADASGDVVAKVKEWFKRAYQGAANAGEIPVLPSGADWVPMDTSPRDMDFLNTQKETAKLIASAFGVPLPLIDNDASTFNNLEQAKERFYTDTVLPMAREWLSQFGSWLLPLYGEGLSFQINEDAIGALEGVRTRKFERLLKAVTAQVLTTDEAREELGYSPLGDDLPEGDVQKAMKLLAYGD